MNEVRISAKIKYSKAPTETTELKTTMTENFNREFEQHVR